MKMNSITVVSLLVPSLTFGCDMPKLRSEEAKSAAAPMPPGAPPPSDQRFVFPANPAPFAPASVALDSRSGHLCKTFAWADNDSSPRGLPLCSELASGAATAPPLTDPSAVGATTAYRGFVYTFDGKGWNKGSPAKKYNRETKGIDPLSKDQYDPLGLFSAENRAKHRLTTSQIQQVANRFGVSYDEAWSDAQDHGYQVPPK